MPCGSGKKSVKQKLKKTQGQKQCYACGTQGTFRIRLVVLFQLSSLFGNLLMLWELKVWNDQAKASWRWTGKKEALDDGSMGKASRTAIADRLPVKVRFPTSARSVKC